MKSISRIDHEPKRTHGYYVRVFFRGEQHAKFFSDKKYGGDEAALDAAIKHRNQVEEELGKPRTERMILVPKNKDKGGVRRYKMPFRRGGKMRYSDVYEASWCPEPGKVRRKRFYVSTLGEREARRRAYEYRRMMERRIYGTEIEKPNLPDMHLLPLGQKF